MRDLLLFHLGIVSALRISDLLSLKVSDVMDDDGNIREYFEVSEIKTKKSNRVTINPKLIDTIELYKTTYPNIINKSDHYLFFAQKNISSWKQGDR